MWELAAKCELLGLRRLYMSRRTAAIHTMVSFSVIVRSKGGGNKSQNDVFDLNGLDGSV